MAGMKFEDFKAMLAKSKVADKNTQLLGATAATPPATPLASKPAPTDQKAKPKKKHKYSAQQVKVDGITFDSKKEAAWYEKLMLRYKAQEINNLRRQVPYELNPGGTFSYKYIADFVFEDLSLPGAPTVVMDCKGYRTKEYKKKKKLMLKVHGIDVVEV